MLSAATWSASVLVRAESPARSVLEIVSTGVGCFATNDVMCTMRPHLRLRMSGMTSFDKRTAFISVPSTPNRHCSSFRSRKAAAGGPPVLVTRMSTWPKRSMVASNHRCRSSAFDTSQATARAPAGAAGAVRAQIDSRHPSAASASATARPRPFEAAATTATRPAIPRSTARDYRIRAARGNAMRKWIGLALLAITAPLAADEGMWLFNRPPRALFKQRYNFEPTQPWLDHLQKASVRFNSGGSGSFVSADGLILTNHHVGLDCLQKISTAKHDYVATGFHAKTAAEEVKCVDLELNVLMSIEDVTQRVQAAVQPNMSPADAQRARRAVMSTIEQESSQKTSLRSDVVTLFQGGEYHLYRYKKYTDVRLVFAPEVAIAFFGGDPDNFEYPRYDLDICIFRAYENNKAVKSADYLKWSATGAKDGELVFVSGNPARTSRLNTLANLQFMRDSTYPFNLNLLRRREVLMQTYAERSIENDRRAHDDLFGVKNSRKAY